jgi:hypothetical protein
MPRRNALADPHAALERVALAVRHRVGRVVAEAVRRRDHRAMTTLREQLRRSLTGSSRARPATRGHPVLRHHAPREIALNSTRVTQVLGVDAYDLTLAETVSRHQLRQIERFLRRWVPGFADTYASRRTRDVG